MNAIDIISRLEKVNFTTEQARVITEIFEEHQQELATSAELKNMQSGLEKSIDASIYKAKYDLVKWIVGGIIANGIAVAFLKLFS